MVRFSAARGVRSSFVIAYHDIHIMIELSCVPGTRDIILAVALPVALTQRFGQNSRFPQQPRRDTRFWARNFFPNIVAPNIVATFFVHRRRRFF